VAGETGGMHSIECPLVVSWFLMVAEAVRWLRPRCVYILFSSVSVIHRLRPREFSAVPRNVKRRAVKLASRQVQFVAETTEFRSGQPRHRPVHNTYGRFFSFHLVCRRTILGDRYRNYRTVTKVSERGI